MGGCPAKQGNQRKLRLARSVIKGMQQLLSIVFSISKMQESVKRFGASSGDKIPGDTPLEGERLGPSNRPTRPKLPKLECSIAAIVLPWRVIDQLFQHHQE